MRTALLLLIFVISAWAARSDGDIEADIRARFARSKVAANGFQVKVRGGVATLTGTANVVQHKGAATRMAKSAGATQVVNNIKIGEAARARAAEKLARARPRAEPRTATTPPPSGVHVPPPVRRATIRH